MSGVDLEDAEVLGLVATLLHQRRQEDGRPLGGGPLAGHPADVLFGQGVGGVDGDVGAGKGLTVHAQDLGHAAQLHPLGEGLQDLVALAGLQAEEGLAALGAGLQEGQSEGVPLGQVIHADTRERLGQALEELHGCHRGARGQVLGQREDVGMVLAIQLTQGPRAVRKEGEGLATVLAGHLAGKVEEARPLGGVNMAEEAGPLLQIGAGVGPAGVGQHLGEAEEGLPVLLGQRGKGDRGHRKAVSGQIVGALGQRVDEAHHGARLVEGEL